MRKRRSIGRSWGKGRSTGLGGTCRCPRPVVSFQNFLAFPTPPSPRPRGKLVGSLSLPSKSASAQMRKLPCTVQAGPPPPPDPKPPLAARVLQWGLTLCEPVSLGIRGVAAALRPGSGPFRGPTSTLLTLLTARLLPIKPTLAGAAREVLITLPGSFRPQSGL